jgi:hypothetical protein
MADKLMRAQVVIPMDGLLPEDYVTNTWHFDADDAGITATDAEHGDAVHDLLQAFYTVAGGELFPVEVGPTATLKVYDMRDPEPRVPFWTDTISLPPGTGSMLPAEVALCMSFRASVVSGQSAARRRGRVFLGPVRTGAGAVVASQHRPTNPVLTNIATAAGVLIDGKDAVPGVKVKWSVYSPTTAAEVGVSLDDAFNDVVAGWLDNAWDTQRRRGPEASSRVVFS